MPAPITCSATAGRQPEGVRDLVYGALFTRGPADLHRTALFVGGSDVAKGEAVLEAIKATFFGPFRVSVLFDANGCNTTAAAAALAVVKESSRWPIRSMRPVRRPGQRRARSVNGSRGSWPARVRLRRIATDRTAPGHGRRLSRDEGGAIRPFATADPSPSSRPGGASGRGRGGGRRVNVLPEDVRKGLTDLKVAIDLNAVPPAGIEGVEATDKADREGSAAGGPSASAA